LKKKSCDNAAIAHGNTTNFLKKSEIKTAQSVQKQQRLKHLLEQATVYSKFLASKFIKNQQQDGTTAALSPAQQRGELDSTNATQPATLVAQPELIVGGKLKHYQLEGLEWLVSLYENGLNGILADEMGLGKTLQCIAFLAFLREKSVYGPFLIAAPLSTLSNWESEIKKFAPSMPCFVYHGNKAVRKGLREKHFGQWNGKRLDLTKFPIIITSYEIIMHDKAYLEKFKWKFIIVDEGHRIKNLNCKLIKTLKQFDSANRLLLTGTPLQNSLTELWSLLNFILPDIFDDLEVFQRWFDVSGLTYEQDESLDGSIFYNQSNLSLVSNLHTILKPFVLRRLKTEVERELPPKKEYLIFCGMSKLQLKYYDAALNHKLSEFVEAQLASNLASSGGTATERKRAICKNRKLSSRGKRLHDEINEDDLSDNEFIKHLEEQVVFDAIEQPASPAYRHMRLQNLLMQLRKICNHPYLFFYPFNVKTDELLIDQNLVHNSGKMVILDQLLVALIKGHHRTLIFCQMTHMLDIIGDYLNWKNVEYCRIDGSTAQPVRETELQAFRSKDIPVFLLSTRAAGLGINLVDADTVIFFDSDWNPQMDLQAQDRAHRIGQTKPVLIYRLLASNSIERKILDKASSKRRLERLVMIKCKIAQNIDY